MKKLTLSFLSLMLTGAFLGCTVETGESEPIEESTEGYSIPDHPSEGEQVTVICGGSTPLRRRYATWRPDFGDATRWFTNKIPETHNVYDWSPQTCTNNGVPPTSLIPIAPHVNDLHYSDGTKRIFLGYYSSPPTNAQRGISQVLVRSKWSCAVCN